MAKRATEPEDVEEIAARLRLLPAALDINPTELSARSGITKQAWSNYTADPPVGRPNLDQAFKLCRAFGLTLDWIYRDDPSRLPHDLAKRIDALQRGQPLPALGSKAAQPRKPT
jgi:transcriptional regulator with XRE-family HTH domain